MQFHLQALKRITFMLFTHYVSLEKYFDHCGYFIAYEPEVALHFSM